VASASPAERGDTEANDLWMAMTCVARAIARGWPEPDWVLRRYLGLMLDELQLSGHTPIQRRPQAADFDTSAQRATQSVTPTRSTPLEQ